MKKTIAYLTVAVFLGIALTLTPLLILREAEPKNYGYPQSLGARGYEYQPQPCLDYEFIKKPEVVINEVMVPVIGLVIASAGYVVLKRKISYKSK